jgi:flagellar basal-body rod protein FlgG
MTRGVYIAASGMLAEEQAQQVIAQNLANASTNGYKEDVPIYKSFDENLISLCSGDTDMTQSIGVLGSGAEFQTALTDFTQGSLRETDNPLDIALTGNAYMAVQTQGNGTCYSRDGALTLDRNGRLVQLASGLPVLDTNRREIVAPPKAGDVKIDPDGRVTAGTQNVGQIGLFAMDITLGPHKIGDNLIQTDTAPRPIDATRDPAAGVRGGFLETSNVNLIREMVSMIAGLRAYEANEKVLQQQDDTQDKSVNQVGRVG